MLFDEMSIAIQEGDTISVLELAEKALAEGIAATVILEEGLIIGINLIGEKFKNNEVFIPEVLVAANAMNTATEF